MAKKPFSLLFLLLLLESHVALFMVLQGVNSQPEESSFSFTIDEFTEDSNLILQGDAIYTQYKTLQLTAAVSNSVGRALYSNPIRLYDSKTGAVASFKTTFKFWISSPYYPGDGLAFFFASVNTTIPPNSGGKYIGLFSGDDNPEYHSSRKRLTRFKEPSQEDQVFAVEFDTHFDPEIDDPVYRHVGIDVNSIKSKTTHRWDWVNGETLTATVAYDPHKKLISVDVFNPDGTAFIDFTHVVDLTTVIPEWVRVGFSASTGEFSQVSTVSYWAFNTTLLEKDVIHRQAHLASLV